jgi:(methylthio)acryloyl-CoA hydratase
MTFLLLFSALSDFDDHSASCPVCGGIALTHFPHCPTWDLIVVQGVRGKMSVSELPNELRLNFVGDVAVLTLARPQKRNALNDVMVRAIGRFMAELPEDVRAVVIASDGDHFCAGLDLAEVVDTVDIAKGILHSQMWHRAFHEIQFGRVPVIAALHGAVVGGGLELAASAHIRVADPTAYYGLPEGQRGIFLGGGGSVRIPKLIGVSRVQDLMLTGRTYGAEEGQQFGISQYLVGKGEALAKAMELARKVATNAILSNYAIMHALPRIAESPSGSGYFTESLMAAAAEMGPEAKQRLRDFLEKRGAKVVHDKS